MKTFIAAALLAAVGVSAHAAQNSVFALGGGVVKFTDDGSSDLTDEYGYYATLGMSAPEAAFLGYPWLDIDGSRHTGDENRIDSLGVLYCERIPLGTAWYIGVGLGSYYNNLKIVEGNDTKRADEWTIGGKALIGRQFGSLFLEGSYRYSGELKSVDTNAWTLGAGIRF